MKKENKNTMTLNDMANTVIKPNKVSSSPHVKYLNENRTGISKLRSRGFSWNQIYQTIKSTGMEMPMTTLYNWKRKHYK